MNKSHRVTKYIAVALATVFSIVLSGCGVLNESYKSEPNNGRGQSELDIESQISSVEGVSSVDFRYIETVSGGEGGLFSTMGMDYSLEVAIKDGYIIRNPSNFVKFLFEEAWSANKFSPLGYISVSITGGVPENYIWNESLDEIFGKNSGAYFDSDIGNMLVANNKLMAQTFGQWAGNVPEFSKREFLELGEIEKILVSPIRISHLDDFSIGEKYSLILSATSNQRIDHYVGDITLTLFDNGKQVYSEKQTVDNQACDDTKCKIWYLTFFYTPSTKPTLSNYTYRLDFTSQSGFDTTAVEG